MKHLLFFGLVPAMLATAPFAQAQTQVLEAGRAYNFSGTIASGTGTMSYQWYRNGEPIPGATEANYILLNELAYGTAEFKRRVISNACPGYAFYTNIVTVSFMQSIGSVIWAPVNVGCEYNNGNYTFQLWLARPDMYSLDFFQWGRYYTPTCDGGINWISSNIEEDWMADPCPSGWRLPSWSEIVALNNSGSAWADANSARGNAVAGRFYGPKSATCTLPDNMNGCIFLSATGYYPSATTPSHSGYGTTGRYWTSNRSNVNIGSHLNFTNTSSTVFSSDMRSGYAVRCVKDIVQ